MKNKESFSTLVILNIFLMLIWVFIVMLAPHYLSKIKNDEMIFHDVNLVYQRGKVASIDYEYHGIKYSSLCRNLIDTHGRSLCDDVFNDIHHTRKNASELKFGLIFNGFYRNSTNIVIIKEVKSPEIHFVVAEDEYEKLLTYWKRDQYLMGGAFMLSFLALNLFYFLKRKRHRT